MKVWLDGRVIDGSEARVPVTDHGLLYGDGVFEGIRLWSGRAFRLEAHLARLSRSARALDLALPDGLADVVLETFTAFGEEDAYARLIVTRGEGALGVDPATCKEPRVICIVSQVALYARALRERGLALVTASVRRPGPDVLDPRVKSLNYLPSVLAKHEARAAGADEALVLNVHGQVAEASVANVFTVREGALLTPPATDGALEGITRDTLLRLAREAGLPARESTLGRQDLFGCEEAFLSGTGIGGVIGVRSLDGRPIGAGRPGPLALFLQARFEALARAQGAVALQAGHAGGGRATD
jgi:branched-chain amino acid aminotransferase